jgi:carbonic anhydrase
MVPTLSASPQRYPMEMHFVHLSNDTTPHLAALALFIEEGRPSAFLDQYFHLFGDVRAPSRLLFLFPITIITLAQS